MNYLYENVFMSLKYTLSFDLRRGRQQKLYFKSPAQDSNTKNIIYLSIGISLNTVNCMKIKKKA